MSPSPVLILAPRVTDDSVSVWRAALANGWTSHRLSNWRVPEDLKVQTGDFVIYAEPLFAEAVADQMGLALMEPPTTRLPSLPDEFVHRKIALLRLSEAALLDRPTFVKPAEGKVFEPRVFPAGSELPSVEQVGDIAVLISDPVTFILEVRCFVAGGKVISASPYWRNEKLAVTMDGRWPFLESEEEEALEFAGKVLGHPEVACPPAFVLDVGITREHGWAVIEGNPCWGAGLYGCDPLAALQCGRISLRRRNELTPEHLKWISKRQSTTPQPL
ncbi:MAG TPA: ATP-grasp domain-containing protein [Verrucomicrobiales bacterium]|nr:ATP-grasp domain-containing protein [Verrucomicrobiales bacterium]